MNFQASVECLLSLPAANAGAGKAGRFFVASDPPGTQLGSGGGTAHLLHAAFLASGEGDFSRWLAGSRKLIVHGSGQSRRLPAYAAEGKPLLPLPLREGVTAQRPGQRLLDAQLETYGRILEAAPGHFRVMVACGDVLVAHEGFLPRYPECDVLIAGLEAQPEEASHHGVMFASEGAAFEFFLQKPEPRKIRELSSTHRYYLDTGVWLLSRRAVELLFARCGWDAQRQRFPHGAAGAYEMFDTFGMALGTRPASPDAEISALKAAVLPLAGGRFHHFGTTQSVVQSTRALVSPAAPETTVWVENAHVPASWTLRGRHMLTGIPQNAWRVDLPAGVCVDMIGVKGRAGWCLRVYGYDDVFKGAMSEGVSWMGRPLRAWLEAREMDAALFDARTDIQELPLFPLVPEEEAGAMLNWMAAENPQDAAPARRWREAERFSARDLLSCADAERREAQRAAALKRAFTHCNEHDWRRLVMQADLAALGGLLGGETAPALRETDAPSLPEVHDAMFHASSDAFALLRDVIIRHNTVRDAVPQRNILDDQIVWGRSPARLDFAGGWTDTPPYCLEHGGRVVNLAVNLNGQPPIQVFGRVCETPHLRIRSIDVGVEEVIATHDALRAGERLGSGFSIARAALRLAGFDPAFNPALHGGLAGFLKKTFGGGIELSLLAAIPKGSGLGTSSILAATLLGTLSEMCGLHWGPHDIFQRTLVLEQMLGSGGGWQDQVGGVTGGLKLVASRAGLAQQLDLRWLPPHMVERAIGDGRLLLYYTGMTRVAQNILGEIVRGLFLNDARRIRVINDIGRNAAFAADAVQRQSWDDFCEAIRRSWRLNQGLDEGTNPPAVQAILDRVRGPLSAAKLLGAGGGGYLMLLATTREDGLRVREILSADPPNPRARFVELSVSHEGFQVTRS